MTAENQQRVKLDDLIPLFGGGFVLGAVAILGCALIDAVGVALYQYFNSEDATSWPPGVVIGFGIFAIAVSFGVGRWLFKLRRWIGLKGDPAEAEMVRRKRRSFTWGAMIVYLTLTPLLWVLIVAIANTQT